MKRCTSFFGGSCASASAFVLRKIKGCRILCNFPIKELLISLSSCCMPAGACAFNSNQSSKTLDELKRSGSIKFIKDHNSCKLFYKGVPVNRSLWPLRNFLRSREICDSSFFNAWASSIIKYFQCKLRNSLKQSLMPLYEVTQTSNFLGIINFARVSTRSSIVASSFTTRQLGSQRWNSVSQLLKVDFGHTIKCGPAICLN